MAALKNMDSTSLIYSCLWQRNIFSDWDARISAVNLSLTIGNNSANGSSTFGYGINSNGIITGHTLTNQINPINTLITIGVGAAILTGQSYLLPALAL